MKALKFISDLGNGNLSTLPTRWGPEMSQESKTGPPRSEPSPLVSIVSLTVAGGGSRFKSSRIEDFRSTQMKTTFLCLARLVEFDDINAELAGDAQDDCDFLRSKSTFHKLSK